MAAVLALGLSGAAFADADSDRDSHHEALLDRVCEIYEGNTGVALDSDELRDAFAQAGEETMAEIHENRLQRLVDEGKITQEQADELAEWWHSKPDDLSMRRFGKLGMLRNHIGHGFGFGCPPMLN